LVFPTVEFAIFFPIVLALSWALMPRPALWKPFILVASYIFYGAASWKFCLLLAGVTLVNQAAALAMGRSEDPGRRKLIVTAAVVADLLVLGVFKYYGFFASEINGVLDAAGLGLSAPLVALAIPLGVSFFVFQSISYIVDVYRRQIEPGKLIDVAIYLAFFPHVVAGPIVRAKEFLPQLASPRNRHEIAVGAGVVLIAIGLIKKVAIADFLAREVADPVFAVPQAYAAPDVLLAAYAYTVQIYCDFSGYTDIAIGLALLMGFVFPQNFDHPYRSTSFREFWRRWHITLSRYLRDFLYIPLGGNRGSTLFTMRNLMLTMLLGGLWHGAAWTFVIWGGIHGTGLAIERLFEGKVKIPKPLAWFVVFHIVVAAWVLFRSPNLSIAGDFFARLTDWGEATLWSFPVVAVVFSVLAYQVLPRPRLDAIRLRIEALQPAVLGAGLAVVVIFVTATIPSQGVPPFIYFQF
jgi:D-alanyl-lipoteichoic acid acyltransferase DltB (MBOAT superfamily)